MSRAAFFVVLLLLGVSSPAWAKGNSAKEGLRLFKTGDCVSAVPLLEQAEIEQHRPQTASALAHCHLALGELLLAFEIYDALAAESPQQGWTAEDRKRHKEAPAKSLELAARLPTVTLDVVPSDIELQVTAAGRSVADPRGPIRVPPDEKIDIEIAAEGYKTFRTDLVLREGADRTVEVKLQRAVAELPAPVKPAAAKSEAPTLWLGAEFRGLLVPTFVMNIVADGGTTTYWPGGFATLTARVSDVDLKTSLGITSYALGTTPFKPHGTPDTEWELVESDLVALTAALDVLYVIPLDSAETVAFKIGAGFGIGVVLTGDIYRTQSYPDRLEPGDPAQYKKCKAPNEPPGSFRYCNQLDKDADRYGQPDQTWGDGGARPVVYPWLSLPQIALAMRPVDRLAIDIELGVTLNGFLTATGFRYGF